MKKLRARGKHSCQSWRWWQMLRLGGLNFAAGLRYDVDKRQAHLREPLDVGERTHGRACSLEEEYGEALADGGWLAACSLLGV